MRYDHKKYNLKEQEMRHVWHSYHKLFPKQQNCKSLMENVCKSSVNVFVTASVRIVYTQ